MLRLAGYYPILASGSLQALNEARNFPGEIHLLLTDIVMPEMDGVELAQQITAERRNIRVLLMTGYTDVACRLPVLRKPFHMAELLDKVQKVIDGPSPLQIIGRSA
jgi:CheY-like chemotaxis protein